MSTFKVVKLLDNPVVISLDGGLNFVGEYSDLTSYTTGDVVSYEGSGYVAIQATTGNIPINITYWQLLAEKGDTGSPGTSYQEQFETVSKNLKSWNSSFSYTGDILNTITYTNGIDTVVKTFNYTGDQLTSIVLSGDTPGGISLTKTLGYTLSKLTSITFS